MIPDALRKLASNLLRGAVILSLLALTRCAGQAGVPGNMQHWNRPFPPYRVIDDIYYVGTNEIAQFLITTPAGHILLDTGFEASVPQLRENVEALASAIATSNSSSPATRTSITSKRTRWFVDRRALKSSSLRPTRLSSRTAAKAKRSTTVSSIGRAVKWTAGSAMAS